MIREIRFPFYLQVLEQQRLEQARFTAAQQRPEQPIDPAEFVRTLPSPLRRQVLADIDDTVLAVLPPEMSQEAQGLRRELEQTIRANQMERRMTQNDFSQLIRHSTLARGPGSGFQSIARLFPRGPMSSWKVTDGPPGSVGPKKLGRQLLDPESLTCLLVLLFLNDSTLNASRLHRILRNLSYHNQTKQWIIFALISILRRTSSLHQESSSIAAINKQFSTPTSAPSSKSSKSGKRAFKTQEELCEEFPPGSDVTTRSTAHEHWLSRTLNLAFGGCVNIFQLQKVGRKSSDYFVTVHQQACLDVCKHTLETLSFLAKNFPSSFAPQAESDKNKSEQQQSTSSSNRKDADVDAQSEFWDILVRLNSSSISAKGKAPSKVLKDFPKVGSSTSFVTSPLGQILSMLSHPVIKQSTLLTDKLLRLLAVISMSLPERPKHLQAQEVNLLHEDAETASQPPDNPILPPHPHMHHTVTFGPDILHESNQEPESVNDRLSDDYEREQNVAESQTVCSETPSYASSLFVEPPEIPEGGMLLPSDVRSPQTSVFSDTTVVHSDVIGDHHTEHESDAMDVDAVSHPISDTSSAGGTFSIYNYFISGPFSKQATNIVHNFYAKP